MTRKPVEPFYFNTAASVSQPQPGRPGHGQASHRQANAANQPWPEQAQWQVVLSEIEQPQAAALVVELFERYPQLQANHPATYLRARLVQLAAERAQTTQTAAVHQQRKPLACGPTARATAQMAGHAMAATARSVGRAARWLLQWARHMASATRQQPTKPEAELKWPELVVQDR